MSELRTLQSLIETLPEHGDRPAVLALHREEIEHWSYAKLDEYVWRLARGLAERSVERGDYVALLAPNRPEYIAASLGVVKAGAVVVPLDVQFDDGELGQVLDDSEARFIFTTSDHTDRLERLHLEATPEPILLDVGEDDERSWRCLLAEDERAELPELEPDDPAALFYTSGTTGRAKGVPLSHANLAFQLNTLLEADLVVEDDRVLLPLPLHHVYPFVIGMLTPLAAGLPIVIPRSLTGPQIVRAVQEGEVSLIVGVPQLYEALYSGIKERSKSGSWVASALFESGVYLSTWLRRRLGLRIGKILLHPVHKRFGPRLRVLASGGAPLDPEMALKLESLGWRVAIGYGLTETSPLLTLNPPDGAKLDSPGRPVPGIEIYIDTSTVPDEESQQQEESRTDEPHQEGEILARGPGVFAGYRNMPEETEEVFTDDGWYRTEDLGYFDDDGYLYVTGRASTLIVTESGENIQPEDVERVYLESPVISEIGVLQKDGQLVAVIVPELGEIRQREDGEVDEAIREAVEERSKQLPSYQRISDYAVTRESLEYTQMGELRRHILEDRYDRAKEGEEDSDETAGPISPEDMSEEDRNLLENSAAERVWELLAERYPDERLTPDTSPQLDLGVDSMEWINLSMEIGESANVELDEDALERIDTVRDLLNEVAEAAELEESAGISPLEQPEEVLSEEQKRWIEPLGPVMATIAWVLFALNWVVMRGLFRLQVEGLGHLPKEGAFVITPNHASYLDSFAVAAALGYRRLRRTYWAGAGAAFSNPFNRFISRLAQAVPVEPAGISSLAFGAAVLKRGRNLIWYPEGQRSPSGELQQFEPGIGVLLNHSRAPVVPVIIYGTYKAMPPGKALVRPKKVTVLFGQPLDVDELEQQGEGEEPQHRLVEALHDYMAEMNNHS